MIARTSPIKKEAIIWGKQSILSTWMHIRYIKGKGLQNIIIKPFIYFAQWKIIIASKDHITKCIDCRAGNSAIWKIGNGKQYLGVVIEVLRIKGPKDTIAKGIYGHTCHYVSKILHHSLEN